MEDLGHSVSHVGDGPSLIRALEAAPHEYDLVISDYAMPLVSGADVIQRAREICSGLPCIMITGYADRESVARRPDNVQIIAKPFTSQQLAEAILTATCRRDAVAAE